MINLLFLFLLIVTIPRYSATFSDIDSWEVFGISVTAVGIAIVAGIGEYFITQTMQTCSAAKSRYRAEWEALDRANKSRNLKTRKLDHIPELKHSGLILTALLISLEAIGLFTQVTHFVSVVRVELITKTLPGISLWFYIGALVFQVSVLQWSLAISGGYEKLLKRLSMQGEQQKAAKKQRVNLRDLLDAALMRVQFALLGKEAAFNANTLAFEPLPKQESGFECPQCSFVGKNQLSLNGHMKKHSNEDVVSEIALEKGNGHHA